MSNENKKGEAQDKKKTELPKIDGNAVEEIPAGELDNLAGGMKITDCPSSCGCTGGTSSH
jgi:hypothetical protein